MQTALKFLSEPKGSRKNNFPFWTPHLGAIFERSSLTKPSTYRRICLGFCSLRSFKSDPNLRAKTESYSCASPKGLSRNKLSIWQPSLGIFEHISCNKISTYHSGYVSDFVTRNMSKSAPKPSCQILNLFRDRPLVHPNTSHKSSDRSFLM